MLGIVTVDDALDVIAEEHEEDLQIAGVGASESGSGEAPHMLTWFARRQYWVLVWAIASGVIAAVLDAAGGASAYVIYPMCAMPVVLLAADRVVSFVRNYFLEYDESEDGGKPYLGFFLQTAGLGVVLAALIYLCGQLVSGRSHRDGERSELRSRSGKRGPGSCRGAAGAGGLDKLCLRGSRGVLLLPGRSWLPQAAVLAR